MRQPVNNPCALPTVGLVKIDCEGFEQHILLGARQTLKRHKPLLFVEIHPEQLVRFGYSTRAVFETLAPAYNLEFWQFTRGQATTKLGEALLKFRRIKAHRHETAEEMFLAAERDASVSQFQWIGRPK